MNRREALERLAVLLGGAASLPASVTLRGELTFLSWLGHNNAAQTNVQQQSSSNGALTLAQRKLAGALAEQILPRTDTPGALDAEVDVFVDLMVSLYLSKDDRELYLTGLEMLQALARTRFAAPFVGCTSAQQRELVAELDRDAFEAAPEALLSRFFRLHKELTVIGYFTSEVGEAASLRRVPYGEYDSDVPLGPEDPSWV